MAADMPVTLAAVIALVVQAQSAAGQGDRPSRDAAVPCTPVGDLLGREEQIAVGGRPWVVLRAKVDTGADRTTVHAERIRLREEGGRAWVAFDLGASSEGGIAAAQSSVEAPVVRFVTVKSSNGVRERRPVVALELCLGSKRRSVLASVTSRESMRLPVLLGRDVLETGYLVDVSREDLSGSPTCK